MQAPRTPIQEHRSKRQTQPSITSYFEVRNDLEDTDHLRGLDPIIRPRHHNTRPTQQPRERLAPDVPDHVQADLLSVGMRVRKSVPEGYKTLKMSSLPSNHMVRARPSLEVRPPREAVPDDYQHQRELLPFCGLHKIGGFATQPTTNPHLYGAGAAAAADGPKPTNDFPLAAEDFRQPFFSSQSSTDSGYHSTTSFFSQHPHNPSKRRWHDEDEVRTMDPDSLFAMPSLSAKGMGMGMGVEVDEVPVSPLSETLPQAFNMLPPTRQFARPKSRRAVQRSMSHDDIDMDFENTAHVEGTVGTGDPSDFEETDFLTKDEVPMGGV